MNLRRIAALRSFGRVGIVESEVANAPRLLWSIRGVAHCLVDQNLRETDR